MTIAKFLRLALAANPNIVETLFFERAMYLQATDAFQRIVAAKHAFLSREVFKRFSGYATGQLKKMESGKQGSNMGAKRKAWLDQIGYDPKDASHLVRLLFNGGELVRLGRLTPRMTDHERRIVRDIKLGQWPLDRVKSFAAQQSDNNNAWFHEPGCILPAKPNVTLIETLLMDIHRGALAA